MFIREGTERCGIKVNNVKNNAFKKQTKHEHMLDCTPKTQSSLEKKQSTTTLNQKHTSVNIALHLRGLGHIHTREPHLWVYPLCKVGVCRPIGESYREQTAPYTLESLSRMSNTDWSVDEIIEIWYRTTRSFSLLDGIEAIRSVPIEHDTQH